MKRNKSFYTDQLKKVPIINGWKSLSYKKVDSFLKPLYFDSRILNSQYNLGETN